MKNESSSPIVKYINIDIHTSYMACSQYADWLPKAMDENVIDAYIVQEVLLKQVIDDKVVSSSHYFEAWKVQNGCCDKDEFQVSHDLFCVGHPLDTSDALKQSIGHTGEVIFIPRVYLINKDNILYGDIDRWPNNIVKEANGLKAVYSTKEIESLFSNNSIFHRTAFVHKWSFDDPDVIYSEVLEYCKKMFRPSNKVDVKNFYMTLDYFFDDNKYKFLKPQIIEAWETCY